jgi:hypothetical protein
MGLAALSEVRLRAGFREIYEKQVYEWKAASGALADTRSSCLFKIYQ